MSLVWIVIFILSYTGAHAQQDPLYAQYINNPFVLNPAYAGFTQNLNTSISYRQQWSGFEGSPTTVNANGHISLLDNRMGAGLMFVSDKIGNSTTTEVLGSYAYRIKMDNTKTLSFGLQAGIANYQIDNTKVNPLDQNDPLFQGTVSETKPSFGAGLILSTDRYFVGLSVPRMLKTSLTAAGINAAVYTQHYYAMGSYLFFLSEHIRLKPSVLLKLVSGAPASVDLNASFILHENYQAGLLTRNFNTYGLFLQGIFKDSFRLGYVFEVPTGSSVGTNFSTHEITLGFRMNVLKFHQNNSVMSF
ncbi:MAG: type IX secretion system membrane protein PorP/SprF [Cyclobacteriaceae bacterium]|nr:type IX secretion system membrane protein PorP/SprF [Cyclobacteriaceae bacterium]